MIKSLSVVVAAMRPLPVALAQSFIATKPEEPRAAVLNRLYERLDSIGQLRCVDEYYYALVEAQR